MIRQLLISGGVAFAILFALLFWSGTPTITAATLALLASLYVQFVQSGSGLRNLATGIKLDLMQMEKTRIEIERLASAIKTDTVLIEKAQIDIEKTREELRTLISRIHLPSAEEVILYGPSDRILRPNLTQEGKEITLRK